MSFSLCIPRMSFSSGSLSRSDTTPAGAGGLYRGLIPPLLTSGCISSVVFSSYEFMKFRISSITGRPANNLNLQGHIVLCDAQSPRLTSMIRILRQWLRMWDHCFCHNCTSASCQDSVTNKQLIGEQVHEQCLGSLHGSTN